jgi:hypothetical protein
MDFSILPKAVVNLDPQKRRKEMSDKYVLVDSRVLALEILKQKDENGEQLFSPENITVTSNKRSNGKHIIRFRANKQLDVDGDVSYPELLIINSYSGESRFMAKLGVFRLICSNGLTISKKTVGEIYVRHIGDTAKMAIEIVKEFCTNLSHIVEEQERLMSAKLNDEQMIQFATEAAEIRWKKTFTKEQAEVLLKAVRNEDEENSVWHVFNRLQEKLINGSDSPISISGKTPRKIRKLSNPSAIDKVNSSLYVLADKFASMEQVATFN